MPGTTSSWSRRAVLGGAAGLGAGVLAGCGGGTADQAARPTSAPTSAPTTSSTASPTSTGTPPWRQLARHTDGNLVLPGSSGYESARLLQDPRFDDLRPLAVLGVTSAADVTTALAFAHDHALPVALRSGGHCYAGWSAGGHPPALVLDCRGLSSVRVHDDGSAEIGPGAPLVAVYAALAARDRAIPSGSCPTVGFGGIALGGGVGVLTRAMGLTCDVVTGLELVTADGQVRTASAEAEPDLYWASRGGGGGHVGVVTGFTVRTSEAPMISTGYLQWPLDQASDVVPAWQDWIADADLRLWSTCKLLGGDQHPDGAIVEVSFTWAGSGRGATAAARRLLQATPRPEADVRHRRSYRDTMLGYAGCLDIPVEQCTTYPGGRLERQAFAATSHVAGEPLDDAGVQRLVERAGQAQGSGLAEAGVSIDALGGVAGEPAPDDTAFFYRRALATVQYTATYSDKSSATVAAVDTADAYVRGFRDAMTSWWGDTAYVNYPDPTLADPSTAYFGANAERLAGVRLTYDPDGFFTQPQDW